MCNVLFACLRQEHGHMSLRDVQCVRSSDKFRLKALLESMQSISPSVTVIVDDDAEWIKSALTDEISAAFDDAEWNIEYKEEEEEFVIKSKAHCVVYVI